MKGLIQYDNPVTQQRERYIATKDVWTLFSSEHKTQVGNWKEGWIDGKTEDILAFTDDRKITNEPS